MSNAPRDPLDTDCAYDVLAPAYDLLAAGYACAPWLEAIARPARSYGPAGRRALDVACGTGRSLEALLALDLNTPTAYREAGDRIVEDGELLVLWHGGPARLDEPGGRAVVAMDVLHHRGDGLCVVPRPESETGEEDPCPGSRRRLIAARGGRVVRRSLMPPPPCAG